MVGREARGATDATKETGLPLTQARTTVRLVLILENCTKGALS